MKHTKQIFTALILIASNVSIFLVSDKLLLDLIVSSLICILFLIYSSSNSDGGKDHSDLEKVAHDLRSPLAVIKMLATSSKFNTKEKELIHIAFERMNKMIDGLLNPKNNHSSSLSQTIGNVIKEKQSISKRSINFTDKLDTGSNFHSPSQLSRALSNLLDNAIEATREKGEIEVKASSGLFYSTIEIKDNGKGMTNIVLKNALEGGFTTKRNGNGIGLSSSKRQVELLGGVFQINSRPQYGTTISIKIPKSTIDFPIINYQKFFAA